MCTGTFWDEALSAKAQEWNDWLVTDAKKNGPLVTDAKWKGHQRSTQSGALASVTQSTRPSPADVRRALASAEATQLEGLHKLPKGVLVARCERHSKRSRDYYAYCIRCSTWLACNRREAETHACDGAGWDSKLAAVADEWEPTFKQMRCAEAAGVDPYLGNIDLTNSPLQDVDLLPARRYLLRWVVSALMPVPLEMFISTPLDPSSSDVLRIVFPRSYRKASKCAG